MLTIKTLITLSHTHRAKLLSNASNVHIAFGKVREGQDARGYYRSIPGVALSIGKGKKKKKFEIRVYYPKTRSKVDQYIPVSIQNEMKKKKQKYEGPKKAPLLTIDAPAWVFCTCEYFLFHCEVADAEQDNSSINAMPRDFYSTKDGKVVHFTQNNGKAPVITNPAGVAHLCKHIISALRKGALLKK